MAKVTFTMDGRPVETEEGTLLIDAAKAAGIEIPHYCYHPALGNPGVCRLCMVEVEGAPKLQVSCRVPVKAGMVARSNSPNARKAQASSLEFHLANHPLDCPVCDQAGECFLQDYYMRYGLYPSAVREDKRHKRKRLEIGPNIMLDNERCILCTRCTRFLDNVTKTSELGIFNRGSRGELLPYPGMTVDNPYSGNIADICPVGALTDKDFRFKVRVWYLDTTPSVCVGCARGCSIDMDSNTKRPWHTDGRRMARFRPRHNPQVNGYWICDEGRYGYKSVDSPLRLKDASVLEGAQVLPAAWPEATARLSAALKGLCEERGSAGLAVVLSGTLSNEDLFAARKLFVDALKAGHILVSPGPDQLGEEDDILRKKEKVPNLQGARALGFGTAVPESSWDKIRRAIDGGELWGLYVVDRDPLAVWGKNPPALGSLALTVYQGSHMNAYAETAGWTLPSSSWTEEEGTFVNFDGLVQRTTAAFPPLGRSRPEWSAWGDMLRALGWEAPGDSPKAVFSRLCCEEPAFAGLDWDGLGAQGKRLAE